MRVVVRVRHKGEYKMVGKVFAVHGVGLVFLHEAGQGSQPHRNLDSPGGIDEVVLEWLIAVGVDEVHHYDRERGQLLSAPPSAIVQVGVLQKSGGRTRVFMPYSAWTVEPDAEYRYPIPWINDFKDLDPAKPKPVQGAML